MTVLDELHFAYGMRLAKASEELAAQAFQHRLPERELYGVAITELLRFAAVMSSDGGEEAFIERAQNIYRESARKQRRLPPTSHRKSLTMTERHSWQWVIVVVACGLIGLTYFAGLMWIVGGTIEAFSR